MMEVSLEAVDLQQMGRRAKAAARTLAQKSTAQKNRVLNAMADALELNIASILRENEVDIELAKRNGVDPIWIRDRIALEPRMGWYRSRCSQSC